MSQDNPGNTDGTENDGTTADGLPEIPVPPVVPPAVPPVEPPVDGPPATPPLAPPVAPPVEGYAPPVAPPAYSAPTAPPAPAPYGYPAATKTPILSILSLVAGILSTIGLWILFIPFVGTFLGIPFPLAALILGYLGKKREPQAAKGLWLAGIIMGYVGLGLAVLALVGWILAAVFGAFDSSSSYNY